MKLFLDAGHGGTEPGAVFRNFVEKDINLAVTLLVKGFFSRHKDIEIITSRLEDTTVSLYDRTNLANQVNADFFISIHHNGGGGDGYEIIHSVHALECKPLAESIALEFDKAGQNRRSVYSRSLETNPNKDYYHVIRETKMPAVITEYAFLDTQDSEAIDSQEELIKEAYAVYKGFLNYAGIPEFVEKEKPVEEVSNINDDWKLDGIKYLNQNGLLTDLEGWSDKKDESMPVWAVTTLLKGVHQDIVNKLK